MMQSHNTYQSLVKTEILATLEKMGLTVIAKFVPFSLSRNKAEKYPSLNWVVTVLHNGKPLLVTDYTAGANHCPSYGAKPVQSWNRPVSDWKPLATAFECESGLRAKYFSWYTNFIGDTKSPILPDTCDVLASLSMDSSVLDYGNFEGWASEFGYDPDSRKGESIYRACLEVALKLYNGLGESGLLLLRETFQDY
ncbi:hypothetical protein UFOVP59_56 [uncultured Caudovirales phage]|uniref:Uncharacterized protein n=1 Tax=uncultured Caudovirales phage TaxID=2100421 RepID=A0A6J5KSJ4_9CAUD|nr:hypothetical protein UFOVP59_56 [uncultured Caudovirales phage]CAB5220937.1 hypothetical protein UFOVP246_59 [uncultured Caudovirales phage]